MSCPQAPARLTENVPAPVFQPEDNFVTWASKLMDWGTEVWKRHQEYVQWVDENCRKKAAATTPQPSLTDRLFNL